MAGITAYPTNFEGYYIVGGTTSARSCGTNAAFVTSGSLARCCPSNLPEWCTRFGKLCENGTLYWGEGGALTAYKCAAAANICVTMTIFEEMGRAAAHTYIDCDEKPAPSTLYRALPLVTTESSPSSTTSSRIETPTPSQTSTSQPSTQTSSSPAPPQTQTSTTKGDVPTPTPGSTNQTSAQEANTPSSSASNAWIAGAVIGGVVALCLVAAVALWGLQMRRAGRSAREQQRGSSAWGSEKGQGEGSPSQLGPASPFSELRTGGGNPGSAAAELRGRPVSQPSPGLSGGYGGNGIQVWLSPPLDGNGGSQCASPPLNANGGSAWLSPDLSQDHEKGQNWQRVSAMGRSELSG